MVILTLLGPVDHVLSPDRVYINIDLRNWVKFNAISKELNFFPKYKIHVEHFDSM
jgi:hypothetical protein